MGIMRVKIEKEFSVSDKRLRWQDGVHYGADEFEQGECDNSAEGRKCSDGMVGTGPHFTQKSLTWMTFEHLEQMNW